MIQMAGVVLGGFLIFMGILNFINVIFYQCLFQTERTGRFGKYRDDTDTDSENVDTGRRVLFLYHDSAAFDTWFSNLLLDVHADSECFLLSAVQFPNRPTGGYIRDHAYHMRNYTCHSLSVNRKRECSGTSEKRAGLRRRGDLIVYKLKFAGEGGVSF